MSVVVWAGRVFVSRLRRSHESLTCSQGLRPGLSSAVPMALGGGVFASDVRRCNEWELFYETRLN